MVEPSEIPDELKLESYDFHLPPENIAQTPAFERAASRLMFLSGNNRPQHHVFSELPLLLKKGDLLVRNNTRVIPARLYGKRSGGGKTEILLTHPAASEGQVDVPLSPTVEKNAASLVGDSGCVRWVCLARPCVHLKAGKVITFDESPLTATVIEKLGGGRVVFEFNYTDEAEFMVEVERVGQLPLPPYIERMKSGITDDDRVRYQTTYAAVKGAVAAPTAGLHFTPELDSELQQMGVNIAHVTLHVGPGTFRPMVAENITEHRMDGEFYCISQETADLINRTRKVGGRVITVGTTSTRTLETVVDENGMIHPGSGWAQIFIRPGYRFKAIDGLITNFHLPKSSLIVLVSTLAGRERVLSAYREAVAQGYRFYSYGDAMLIFP